MVFIEKKERIMYNEIGDIMRKIITIIFILIIVVSLTGCGKTKETDALKFREEYMSLNGEKNDYGKKIRSINIPKENPFVYQTAEELAERIEKKESFLVYFGFAKCPWCRSMIENLLDLADKNNTDIYYVDVLEIRDVKEVKDGEIIESKAGDKYYLKLLTKMKNVLDNYELQDETGKKYDTDEKRIYAPNVIAVLNGKAEKKVEGISSDLKDPYGEITEKMKKESIGQLKCIFKCMEEAGVCTKPSSC